MPKRIPLTPAGCAGSLVSSLVCAALRTVYVAPAQPIRMPKTFSDPAAERRRSVSIRSKRASSSVRTGCDGCIRLALKAGTYCRATTMAVCVMVMPKNPTPRKSSRSDGGTGLRSPMRRQAPPSTTLAPKSR